MAYEVVVVGGGFGGLTAAALLAARGVKVCLLERESHAGGCASSFEKFGYSFETGAGLYAGWGSNEIHQRVFADLPVSGPEVRLVSPSYLVRLPDQTEISVNNNDEEFEQSLRASFPECADAAVRFYDETTSVADALLSVSQRYPDLLTASRLQRLRAIASQATVAPRILSSMDQTALQRLDGTSDRFRRFIDSQLQMFGQRDSQTCAYVYAAIALTIPRRGMYAIRGGASSLAESLVDSIRKSGGVVRFDTPVLRLSYNSSGHARGVDLLSGEFVKASRAIISNLTVWDTYGKLVGLNRTPDAVRKRLSSLQGWGAYLIFAAVDEETSKALPAENLLSVFDWQVDQQFDPESAQFMMNVSSEWDSRAPAGKRAATISTFTEPSQWFAYHQDDAELDEQDQATLETWWQRIHRAMPELGDGIEVIDTATPRSFYENTRRKLGMVGGVGQSLETFGPNAISHRTFLPNLFMVGDTTFPGQGVAAVTMSGLIVANEICPK